jgi:hypothetical protein
MPNQVTVQLTPVLAGFTYGELKTYFASRFDCDNSHIATIIKGVINEMISRHDWKWLHATSTITTIAGQATYSVEPDTQYVDGDMSIPANGAVVFSRDLYEVRRQIAMSVDESNMPRMFARDQDGSVLFHPTPDTVYTVIYDYTKVVSDDATQDSEYPPVPRHMQHVLISGIEEKLRMDDDRFDSATTLARGNFERQLLNAIWRESAGERVEANPDMLPPSAPGSHWGPPARER